MKRKLSTSFFNLSTDFLTTATLSEAQSSSYDQEKMEGPGSWIFISGLFNVPGIKMLIKILQDEIYFGGTADINYEKGGIKLSRCLH